jgi:hypothetical protein
VGVLRNSGSLALLVALGCSEQKPQAPGPSSVAQALAGDPVVKGELALDTPVEYPAYYFDASIVRGDSSYLFIWKHDVASINHVYGIRYAFDGTRLDQGAIPIAVPGAFTSLPRGCFNGTNWVVTWLDEREGGDAVYAARIAQDGTPLDPEGIAIDVGAGYIGYAPALGCDAAGTPSSSGDDSRPRRRRSWTSMGK